MNITNETPDTERLKRRIRHSGDFTAIEKRWLEQFIETAETDPPPPCGRCRHLIDTGDYTYCERRGVCIPEERQDARD